MLDTMVQLQFRINSHKTPEVKGHCINNVTVPATSYEWRWRFICIRCNTQQSWDV